jgi:hypothetical protein
LCNTGQRQIPERSILKRQNEKEIFSMRNYRRNLKVITGAPRLPIKRIDISGIPDEVNQEGQMGAVRWEWLRQFGRLRKSDPALTLTEIRSIEARVRKALYP